MYEATMIIAKPAHTMPRMRAEKLRGAPGGREARSDWHKGLIWSPKPCPSHQQQLQMCTTHPLCQELGKELPCCPNQENPSSCQGMMSHPEWTGSLGQEKQPITHGEE